MQKLIEHLDKPVALLKAPPPWRLAGKSTPKMRAMHKRAMILYPELPEHCEVCHKRRKTKRHHHHYDFGEIEFQCDPCHGEWHERRRRDTGCTRAPGADFLNDDGRIVFAEKIIEFNNRSNDLLEAIEMKAKTVKRARRWMEDARDGSDREAGRRVLVKASGELSQLKSQLIPMPRECTRALENAERRRRIQLLTVEGREELRITRKVKARVIEHMEKNRQRCDDENLDAALSDMSGMSYHEAAKNYKKLAHEQPSVSKYLYYHYCKVIAETNNIEVRQ